MNKALVKLWGTTIGYVTILNNDPYVYFQYDPDFIKSGIEVSPLVMPLSNVVYRFPHLDFSAFHGLPGLLADALPDRFGNAIFNAWLAASGRNKEQLTIIERLCYIANRGMGALEFVPAQVYGKTIVAPINVQGLIETVNKVYTTKVTTIHDPSDGLLKLMEVGTSTGGMRAKASLLYNAKLDTFRSGQVEALPDETYCILKFGGVVFDGTNALTRANYSQIEYAYYLMAIAAGITMSESQLYMIDDTYHFMTKRFDRITLANGKRDKLHMQTLGALLHINYNEPRLISYEETAQVMMSLNLHHDQINELYRRMIFNVITRNLDDHVKNISFLMDRRGNWSLAPAYDITLSYNAESIWVSEHQMLINGKASNITLADVLQTAQAMSIKRVQALKIINEVVIAVKGWQIYAAKAHLSTADAETIYKLFNHHFITRLL